MALSDAELVEALPPLARQESALGAFVFTRFYLDLHPTIFESDQDAVLFAQLSHPSCTVCVEWLDASNGARAADLTVEGGYFIWEDLSNPRVGGLGDDGYWYVQEHAEMTDMYTYDLDGIEQHKEPGTGGTIYAQLEYADGYWLMRGVDVEADEA